MAFQCKVGSFNTGTGAAATTVAVTGVGFTPKAIIFWWSGRTGTGEAAGGADHQRGFGVAVSPTSRHAIATQSDDGVATAAADQAVLETACVYVIAVGSSTTDGLLDLQSMDADGFTLVVDDQFTASYRVQYIALGGTELTNVARGNFTESTGTQDVTVGFQPDFVLLMHIATGGNPITGADSRCGIGFAAAPWASGDNGCWAGGSNDGALAMQAMSYCRAGQSAVILDAGVTASNSRSATTAVTSTAFTQTFAEIGSTTRTYFYLALKGGSYKVGNLLTQTDTTTDIVVSGLGFQPAGVLLLSSCRAQDADDTPTNHDAWSMGAFDATSDVAMGLLDQDAADPSVIATAVENDSCYVNLSTGDAIEGLMHKIEINQGGFICEMTDADPSQSFVTYAAFGANVSPPPRSKFDRIRRDTTTRM